MFHCVPSLRYTLVQYGDWQAPFIVAAGLLIAGAAVWAFWLDPEKSVVETAAK